MIMLKKRLTLSAILLASLTFSGLCSASSQDNGIESSSVVAINDGASVHPSWWKEAVFYQIYPRSFKDSNGDGIGDLKGITEKLDYLKDLGVNGIWINPHYDSPNVDNGYDIRDYRKIIREYGTMEDFELLIAEMKKRDMHMMIDVVVNHSSDLFDLIRVDRSSEERWRKKTWQLSQFRQINNRLNNMTGEYGWNTFFLNNHDNPRLVSHFGDDRAQWRELSAKALATMALTQRATPALIYGAYQYLDPDNNDVYAYTRILDGEKYLIVVNFWEQPVSYALPESFSIKKTLLESGMKEQVRTNAGKLELQPWQSGIYQLN
ncbi:alpha amylase catalytic region [Brenneria sp. EniD312]|nr:alpha amylase catalytic region [Brenneria sp. EniD312]